MTTLRGTIGYMTLDLFY